MSMSFFWEPKVSPTHRGTDTQFSVKLDIKIVGFHCKCCHNEIPVWSVSCIMQYLIQDRWRDGSWKLCEHSALLKSSVEKQGNFNWVNVMCWHNAPLYIFQDTTRLKRIESKQYVASFCFLVLMISTAEWKYKLYLKLGGCWHLLTNTTVCLPDIRNCSTDDMNQYGQIYCTGHSKDMLVPA